MNRLGRTCSHPVDSSGHLSSTVHTFVDEGVDEIGGSVEEAIDVALVLITMSVLGLTVGCLRSRLGVTWG